MIGGNFRRFIGNSQSDIKKLEEATQKAREEFGDYGNMGICGKYRDMDRDNFSFDKLNALETQVEQFEYELYCARYEDERRRTW